VSALNLDNPEDKSALISKFRPILAGIDDIPRRAHYVHKLATLLQMTDNRLQSELFYLTKSESQGRSFQKTKKIADIDKIDSAKRIEIYYLALLIKFPDLAMKSDNLDTNYFEHPENKDILLRWQSNPSADVNTFAQSLDPAMRQYFDNLVSFGNRLPPSLIKDAKERKRALDDCINRLQERYVKSLEVHKELSLAEEREPGNSEMQLAKLIEHGISESQQLHDIFQKRGRLFSRTKGD
jgi:DNA primase